MNWSKLIIEIEEAGLSLTEISRESGAPISTISDIKQARTCEPRGTLAISLMNLHARLHTAPFLKETEHV